MNISAIFALTSNNSYLRVLDLEGKECSALNYFSHAAESTFANSNSDATSGWEILYQKCHAEQTGDGGLAIGGDIHEQN